MPGRPDFSQAGSQGSGQVVATTDRPELVSISQVETSDLPAGTTETVDIFAPSGSIYRPLNVDLSVASPSGSSNGIHQLTLNSLDAVTATFAESNHGDDLRLTTGKWRKATSKKEPTTESAIRASIESLVATENSPIKILYLNDTDVVQAKDRSYEFVMQEDTY